VTLAAMAEDSDLAVERLDVSAFTGRTSSPEADGTLAWNETTTVIARALVRDAVPVYPFPSSKLKYPDVERYRVYGNADS
jgi:hypothetical protein